jgi:hypothetical protein
VYFLTGTDNDLVPVSPLRNTGSPVAAKGIFMGRQHNRLPFFFDPLWLKSEGFTEANCYCFLGKKGRGKSSFVKQYALRSSLRINGATGRPMRFGAVNHKTELGFPEYGPLAEAMGGSVVTLTNAGLNILDPLLRLDIDEDTSNLTQVITQIRASTNQQRGGWVTDLESAIMTRGLQVLRSNLQIEQSLFGLMQVLNDPNRVHPTLPTGEPMEIDIDVVRATARDLVAVLLRLHGGDFGKTFGGRNSLTDYLRGRMVVFDYAGLSKQATSLFQTILWSQRAAAARHDDVDLMTDVSIDDENHELTKDPVYARFMSAHIKKVRMEGGVMFFLTHRLEDYQASGHQEVVNMIEDMDGYFIAQLPMDAARTLQRKLSLSEKTTVRLTQLSPHEFCFIIPGYPEVFFTQSPGTPFERDVCETDRAHARITRARQTQEV